MSDNMQKVKNKYSHILKSDSHPAAPYIIADALPVAGQDRLVLQDIVSPHDQYLSLFPS